MAGADSDSEASLEERQRLIADLLLPHRRIDHEIGRLPNPFETSVEEVEGVVQVVVDPGQRILAIPLESKKRPAQRHIQRQRQVDRYVDDALENIEISGEGILEQHDLPRLNGRLNARRVYRLPVDEPPQISQTGRFTQDPIGIVIHLVPRVVIVKDEALPLRLVRRRLVVLEAKDRCTVQASCQIVGQRRLAGAGDAGDRDHPRALVAHESTDQDAGIAAMDQAVPGLGALDAIGLTRLQFHVDERHPGLRWYR